MAVPQNRRPRPRPRSGAWWGAALKLAPFINGYRATILAPVNGAWVRDRRPDITVVGENTGFGAVDIQIEWRSTIGGPVVYTSNFFGAVAGTPQILEPPSDLAYYNWYYRARAGDYATNTWSAYTGTQYLTVYPLPGFAHRYLDINIGVENIDPVRTIAAYSDLNIGFGAFNESDGFAYLDFNIGLEPQPRVATEYLEMNVVPQMGPYEPATFMDVNVTSGTPTPHIWYVQPQIGPQGLMFRIVGNGFGVSQGQYNGRVFLGDLECPIQSWVDVPETATSVVRITRPYLTDDSGVSNGYLRPGTYNTNSVIFQEGDYLELNYRRLSPSTYIPDDWYWTPYFYLRDTGSSNTSPNMTNWFDQWGNHIDARLDIPVGTVLNRKFIVPAVFWQQSTYRGANFGWRYQAQATGERQPNRPAHVVEIQNYVYRAADGTPKLWAFGEDGSAVVIPTNYITVSYDISVAFDGFIDQGATNKAHQEILALVPDGAESGMVQVVLEV